MIRKSLIILTAALLLVGLLASCSSTGWVTDPYSLYDQRTYLCAVGSGSTSEQADLAARRELASLFGMAVQSNVSRTIYETSLERGNQKVENSGEFFTSTATVSVNAENLYGVEIAQRTILKDGTCMSLAVMERRTTSDYYLARLESDSKEISDIRDGISSLYGTLRGVSDAVTMIRKTSDYNTAAVMCNYISGNDIPFRSLAEYIDIYRKAKDAVVLEVSVDGDESGAVKSAVSKIFTDAGFTISQGSQEPTARVNVTIVWRETAGTGVASTFRFADYNTDVSVVDLAENESLFVRSYKGKEGHQNLESAKARAVTTLINQIEDDLKPLVDESFTY